MSEYLRSSGVALCSENGDMHANFYLIKPRHWIILQGPTKGILQLLHYTRFLPSPNDYDWCDHWYVPVEAGSHPK